MILKTYLKNPHLLRVDISATENSQWNRKVFSFSEAEYSKEN